MNRSNNLKLFIESNLKKGDRVHIDFKQAKLHPETEKIVQKMIKNGGDGKLLIVSLDKDYANVAGWEGDAILGTARVPIVSLRESLDSQSIFKDYIFNLNKLDTNIISESKTVSYEIKNLINNLNGHKIDNTTKKLIGRVSDSISDLYVFTKKLEQLLLDLENEG